MNGDLGNSKKSTLLVEDFIKVDVVLVKVCHKRRKVRHAVRSKIEFFLSRYAKLSNYSSRSKTILKGACVNGT